MSIDYEAIGCNVKKFRNRMGLTQIKLGEKSGIEPSNISHIERGATKVSLPTLVSIANALEVSLDEIIYDSLVKNEHIKIELIDDLIKDCTSDELSAVIDIVKTTLKKIKKNKY